MGGFLLRRIGQAIVTIFGVATLVFFLQRLTGDPVFLLVPENATQADIDALRHALGFDRPLVSSTIRRSGPDASGRSAASSASTVRARSLVIWQHTQPFASIVIGTPPPLSRRISPSRPISPASLTMIAVSAASGRAR